MLSAMFIIYRDERTNVDIQYTPSITETESIGFLYFASSDIMYIDNIDAHNRYVVFPLKSVNSRF